MSTPENRTREQQEFARKDLILLIISLVLSLVILIFLMNLLFDLTAQIRNKRMVKIDDAYMYIILSLRSEKLTPWVIFITNMGNALTYLLIIPVSAAILYKLNKRWLVSLEATVILISATLLNSGLKNWISRPRPDIDLHLVAATSYSYPSGHAMSAVAFYGFLIFLAHRFVTIFWLRWFLIVALTFLIGLIGLSRIYLGVHYPSDVLAGFLAGLLWLLTCLFFLSLHKYYLTMRQKVQ